MPLRHQETVLQILDGNMLTAAGVHGILPHHARQLSDAAASICKCFKNALEAHPDSPNQPSHKRMKLTVQSSSVAESQQPGQTSESTSEQHQRLDQTDSDREQQPPVAITHQQQQHHLQQTLQMQSSANPDTVEKAEFMADSQQQRQQQQQLPEQLLQQPSQHAHPPQQLQEQITQLQQQQQYHQHQQQRDEHHQTQPAGCDPQPGADLKVSTHQQLDADSTPSLLHADPLHGIPPVPAAASSAAAADIHSSAVVQQPAHLSQEGCIGEEVAAEQRQPDGRGAAGHQTTDGVWQALLPAAVCHHQELCQQLTEQCRQEESDIPPTSWKLAGREQFEETASMADFRLSDLPLAGDCLAVVCT